MSILPGKLFLFRIGRLSDLAESIAIKAFSEQEINSKGCYKWDNESYTTTFSFYFEFTRVLIYL